MADYEAINNEVNKLATELSSLDRSTDSARARTIESRITEIELGMLIRDKPGKGYFPLLKKHNGALPYEELYDILVDVLVGLLRNYKAEKASFATALSHQLNLRVKDYFTKTYGGKFVVSLDLLRETQEGWDVPCNPDFAEGEHKSVAKVFIRLAPLIAEKREIDKHLNISRQMWYERFFTFDVTKTVKDDVYCAKDAVSASDLLFPAMDSILLEYLLYGTFTHMRDVVANELKNEAMLNKRNEVIQKCYSISKPTVCKRNAKYYEAFKKAVYE
jgi:hypothetical protein